MPPRREQPPEHFDDFALERPWLRGPSDLPPYRNRDDHRQHLVPAAFTRRELKGDRLSVFHSTSTPFCPRTRLGTFIASATARSSDASIPRSETVEKRHFQVPSLALQVASIRTLYACCA